MREQKFWETIFYYVLATRVLITGGNIEGRVVDKCQFEAHVQLHPTEKVNIYGKFGFFTTRKRPTNQKNERKKERKKENEEEKNRFRFAKKKKKIPYAKSRERNDENAWTTLGPPADNK